MTGCLVLSMFPPRLPPCHLLNGQKGCSISQASSEAVDDTVCNAEMCGLQHGDEIVRAGERISLTVRRVERTMPQLLRL